MQNAQIRHLHDGLRGVGCLLSVELPSASVFRRHAKQPVRLQHRITDTAFHLNEIHAWLHGSAKQAVQADGRFRFAAHVQYQRARLIRRKKLRRQKMPLVAVRHGTGKGHGLVPFINLPVGRQRLVPVAVPDPVAAHRQILQIAHGGFQLAGSGVHDAVVARIQIQARILRLHFHGTFRILSRQFLIIHGPDALQPPLQFKNGLVCAHQKRQGRIPLGPGMLHLRQPFPVQADCYFPGRLRILSVKGCGKASLLITVSHRLPAALHEKLHMVPAEPFQILNPDRESPFQSKPASVPGKRMVITGGGKTGHGPQFDFFPSGFLPSSPGGQEGSVQTDQAIIPAIPEHSFRLNDIHAGNNHAVRTASEPSLPRNISHTVGFGVSHLLQRGRP